MQAKIILFIVLIISLIYILKPSNREIVTISDVSFKVVQDFADKDEAARMIYRLNNRMLAFLQALKNKYYHSGYDLSKYNKDTLIGNELTYDIVHRMLTLYNYEVLEENDPRGTSETSYTIDKGRKMVLCLREKTPPYNLHQDDLVFFIMLHEIAHIGSRAYGHGLGTYWPTFKFVLHEAKLAGVYTPINYKLYPRPYCGLNVNYNPLYDDKLPSLWDARKK